QTGHHCQNSSESDCRNNRHKDGAANFESQQRCRCVCATCSIQNAVRTNQCCCTVAQYQGDQVESTDDADCPSNGATSLCCGRNRGETHQNVRQTSGTQNQGQTQGNEVNLGSGGCTVLQTWLHNFVRVVATINYCLRISVGLQGSIEQGGASILARSTDQVCHEDDTCYQQTCLNHLHVGSALHAADKTVGDHDAANGTDHYCLPVELVH